MKRISEYSEIIERGILDLKIGRTGLETLYEPIRYGLEAGGKRLRPVMVLMAAEAFGGEEAVPKALDAAIGYEIFHNFTLLHDDVMDDSPLRRGRPSVRAKWDDNAAILSGDTMLTLATERVAMVDDKILRPILDIFNRMAIEVYEGQRLDMDFESRTKVSQDEYLDMIALKTGALLGAALETGALIGGASEKDAELMYEFGLRLGIAFQMEDDWLDTFGDAGTFGKPIGGDIRNGKKTYLMVSAAGHDDADREALSEAMGLQDLDLRVKAATRIMERMGIRETVRKDIESMTSKAMGALKASSLGEEQKEAFRKLADKLASRKK